METYIYLVRHAESPYTEGNERTRGLTTKGYSDLATVTEILQSEEIDVIVSSLYSCSVNGGADRKDTWFRNKNL